MRYLLRLAAAVPLIGCELLAASCGYGVKEERLPETGATLEGEVKYGSEKVPLALIIVTGPNGSATGKVNEETGRYKVENAPLGEVKIGVNTDAMRGELQSKMMAGYYKGPEAKAKGIVAPPKVIDVPAKFGNPDTSGIKTTISSGENTFNITIPK
ncbi:MAG TPA: hypothetical protein VKE74_10440 [Gemmataceae bacterium]|nr:hypothetical protein [Gemmataceae bacterium]